MKAHYNTTAESGAVLVDFERKAQSQDDLILDFYRRNYHRPMSPSQVHDWLGLRGVPITSIRRAISNLTARGLLEKTQTKVSGKYGRPEYCWQLVRRPGEQAALAF